MFDTGLVALSQALIQSVSDDEIAAEFASSWGSVEDGCVPARLSALRPLERSRVGDPKDLVEAAERVRPVSLAREQVLPVAPVLSALLPEGLARGSSIAVTSGEAGGGGSTALAFALAASASTSGSWVATVGLPEAGLAAVAEIGVALERLAVIGTPPPQSWATVVASLVGAFDVVLIAPPPAGRLGEARRLMARARERGSVLIQIGKVGGLEVDLHLTVTDTRWFGLGEGHGRLCSRRLEVEACGRRAAARIRRSDIWLPDADGRARLVDPDELG